MTSRKLHRRDGPETSRLGAEDVQSRLGQLQRWAIDCVQKIPGATSLELAKRFCDGDPRKINRRLGECRVLGLLKNGAARKCKISGRKALTWFAVDPVRKTVQPELFSVHDASTDGRDL